MRIRHATTTYILLFLAVLLAGCGSAREWYAQTANEPIAPTTAAQASDITTTPGSALMTPTASPTQQDSTCLDSRYHIYTDTYMGALQDPTGRVSFEYPDDWTISIITQIGTLLSFNLIPPQVADSDRNMDGVFHVSISTVAHENLKYLYLPGCSDIQIRNIRPVGSILTAITQIPVLNWITPVYVPGC